MGFCGDGKGASGWTCLSVLQEGDGAGQDGCCLKRSRLERDAHTAIPGIDSGVGGGRAFLYGWRDLGG